MSDSAWPDASDGADAAAVLDQMRNEIAALFDDSFPPAAIRTDVDVLESDEPLVTGRELDSLDLVQVMAMLERRFDVALATLLDGDEPLTLTQVARRIAEAIFR